MTLPEKFKDQYGDLSHDELLAKLHESENANVKNKKATKEVEKEYT